MIDNRVYNMTRRSYLRHNQAARAVEACACAWVEFGVSLRDLTLAEAIAARNHRASLREPLPYAEIFGVVYEAAPGAEMGTRRELARAVQANRFAQEWRPA